MSAQATDAFVVELHALWKRLLDNYDIDVPQLLVLAGQLRDSLPTCRTCGGAVEVFVGEPHHLTDCDCLWDQTPCAQTVEPCPDCVDGKVSIEQLAATWRAVWGPYYGETVTEWSKGWLAALDHLRAVRP